MRRARDRGETLIEIVLTVVIIGVAVSALVSGLATAANASGAQRESVVADLALRNLAETAKAEVQRCNPGEPLALVFTGPDRWEATVVPGAPACPEPATPLRLALTVTNATGHTASLDVVLRSP